MEASLKENRKVIINDSGSRIPSNDNEATEVPNKLIPTEYQYISYTKAKSYVWFSVFLVIRLFDSRLTEYVLRKYKTDYSAYE